MEQLQSFDDGIVNLILQYSLLDLSAPEKLTSDEAYAAAELALQISTQDGGAGDAAKRPPSGVTGPLPTRDAPEREPPARDHSARKTRAPAGRKDTAAKDGVIGADERREMLLDSDSEAETEGSGSGSGSGETCVACAGRSADTRRLSCGCTYCAPCLRRCIRAGLRNEESWPPKCHERLAEEDVRWARRPGLLRLWRQMATEWDSPAAGRLYCSRPACAAFLPREGGEAGEVKEVRCGACGDGTCGGCRRAWHPGLPCGEEEEEEQLMDMMDQYGYASCNNCRRIVDLRDGCNHITCGCGHQFCYLCGETWKTCLCPRHGSAQGRRPARERAQQYRQSHDNLPFAPQAPDPDLVFGDDPALGFVPPQGGAGARAGPGVDFGGHAPPPAEWFPGGLQERDLDWLVPPPADWRPGAEIGRDMGRDMGGLVPPPVDYPGAGRMQDLERGLGPPPADWAPPPPPPPAGPPVNRNANANANGDGGLVLIDDGSQPRDPGATYVYDWEVTPGRQPWVRRYPPGHPGDRGPGATVQTRFLAEGEQVHPAVMPRGDGGGMVFLPHVDSSDGYDSSSDEESEEERRRRERRERKERRGRHREEPRRATGPRQIAEPRRAPEPSRQARGPRPAQEAPRAPDLRTRYDIAYTRDGRPRTREALCAHHLPTQWNPSRAASPPCRHCRGAHRGRELWRCVGCGAQACRRHMALFGLSRREADREVAAIGRRTQETGLRFASFLGFRGLT